MVDRIPHDAPVLVIGLGRFGAATAGQLQRLDREVLAIDADAGLVQKWSERVTHAVQADARSIDALRQIGAQDFSVAVVAVGSSVEASVLITANLVDLKIPQIWAKAISQSHGKILSRIGANHVIYPEAEAGERVAHLVSGRMIDFIEFDDDFAIVKMYPPKPIRGMSLAESGVRPKYGITVVGVKSPGKRLHLRDVGDRHLRPRPHHRQRQLRTTSSASRRSTAERWGRRGSAPRGELSRAGECGGRRAVEHPLEVGLLHDGDRTLGRAVRARHLRAQLGRANRPMPPAARSRRRRSRSPVAARLSGAKPRSTAVRVSSSMR